MNISDVMTRDVIAVSPATPIHKAAQLMVEHAVSGLPVIDDVGQLVGMVSEGDLILRQKPRPRPPWWRLFLGEAERMAAEYRKAVGTTVGEVMTTSVISISPELPLESAAVVLDKHRLRRLPVVSDGALVGIVARGDLVKALAAAAPAAMTRTDAELLTEMRARIAREPWTSRFSVLVGAKDGVLSLWGIVSSDTERAALETMARAIPGCTGIDNQLAVRSDRPYRYGV